MDNNNWPGEPGVPLNSDQEGWHWVQRVDKGFVPSPRIILWTDDWTSRQFSWDAIGYEADERKLGRDFRYLGPCLTPAEVDARVKEAKRDALEEAAEEMDCACPQRGAVLEKLAKDGPLSHHWPCEKSDDCCALRGAAIRALQGEAMTDPIRAALEKAWEQSPSFLVTLSSGTRRATLSTVETAEIIAAFLRALPTTDPAFFAQLHNLADAVLAAAKEQGND